MELNEVRDLVVKKFGKAVSSHYDVLQLQDAIYTTAGKRISTQTIKRFFGLIRSTSRPDPATLDALAGYLTFSSYKDLEKWQEVSGKHINPAPTQEWASEIVLQIVQDIKPESLLEPGLLQLIKNLFVLFERHPLLPSIVYPKLAASEFGRRLFFEQFIHYDALALHYGMGLEQYLVHENDKGHRTFAYCMLMLRNFLTGEQPACKYYFSKLAAYTTEEVETFHPFVIGRYYGSRVLMNAIEGLNSPEYVDEQVQQILKQKRKATDLYHGYPCAEMVFSETLIFTGHFSQAYNLLKSPEIRNYTHPPYMDLAFKTHLEVMRLTAGVYSGLLAGEHAKKELEFVQKMPVYFLCTNYMQLMLHLVKYKLGLQPRLAHKKVKQYINVLGYQLPAAFH